ncbi:MAG: hypothetical protein SFU91_13355 [Chloroherpetonaceae bacterium]|nr:hypothetical protein [Chloroherpetonaceae bacterium]
MTKIDLRNRRLRKAFRDAGARKGTKIYVIKSHDGWLVAEEGRNTELALVPNKVKAMKEANLVSKGRPVVIIN